MSRVEIVSGEKPKEIANEISDALYEAITNKGRDPATVLCIAAAVLADYGRGTFGTAYLNVLASIILARAARPMPATEKPH